MFLQLVVRKWRPCFSGRLKLLEVFGMVASIHALGLGPLESHFCAMTFWPHRHNPESVAGTPGK